jgi:hypothetical protein
MKKQFSKYLLTIFSIFLLSVSGKAQNCEQLTAQGLREMLVQLGYEVTDMVTTPGAEKYTVTNKTAALNVPVGYELSASKSFLWLTVNLGKPRADSSVMNAALLRENAKIQPCQFYITAKGTLMMGFALENRGLTNAILRKHTDKIIADVQSTTALWQK